MLGISVLPMSESHQSNFSWSGPRNVDANFAFDEYTDTHTKSATLYTPNMSQLIRIEWPSNWWTQWKLQKAGYVTLPVHHCIPQATVGSLAIPLRWRTFRHQTWGSDAVCLDTCLHGMPLWMQRPTWNNKMACFRKRWPTDGYSIKTSGGKDGVEKNDPHTPELPIIWHPVPQNSEPPTPEF